MARFITLLIAPEGLSVCPVIEAKVSMDFERGWDGGYWKLLGEHRLLLPVRVAEQRDGCGAGGVESKFVETWAWQKAFVPHLCPCLRSAGQLLGQDPPGHQGQQANPGLIQGSSTADAPDLHLNKSGLPTVNSVFLPEFSRSIAPA